MRFTGLLILGVACLVASGCASQVHVTSDPQGAAITINGQHYGQTPQTLKVRSSTFGSYTIHLEKEGYVPVDAAMPKQVHVGRLIVDILFFWPAALFNAAGPKAPPYAHHYVLEPIGEG
ncbi:MAG: PEGA domain-containing protein [Planctomycetota bacterium]|nr:PEGA domain-containing protein [Planctomycetota bacterium]